MRNTLRYLLLLSALSGAGCGVSDWGAYAIVQPWRRPVAATPRLAYEAVAFESQGLRLEGWLFRARVPRRGLIVYLHGIGDNRQSGIGIAERFVARGYDIFAFDGRGQGRSQGRFCTYGYYERHDISRALDALHAGRAILFGSSLGAAVALQTAAIDPRVVAVVAQAPFSDLPSIVRFRAPWYLPERYVKAALARAGELGGFPPEEASPLASAPRIRVPVLLIHGTADRHNPPGHSQQIYAALAGPKRLILVPGAGHGDALGRAGVWREIDSWIDAVSPASP
jgi:uncharacterized protein